MNEIDPPNTELSLKKESKKSFDKNVFLLDQPKRHGMNSLTNLAKYRVLKK